MPGILKHWFDEVFAYQFAYGSRGNKLKGKNFIPSFTVGSSESSYNILGSQHFRVYEFCKNLEQTALFAQMNYIDPMYFHETSVSAGFSEEDIRNSAIQHVKKLLSRIIELQ